MRVSTPFKLAATAAAVALLATACGGDDDDGDEGTAEEAESPAVAEGGTLRIYSSEPAFLVPTAADDQPSILIIRQLYSGLVYRGPALIGECVEAIRRRKEAPSRGNLPSL